MTPPILKAALLCDRILQEADGTLSAIRIVDRLSAEIEGEPEAPAPPIPIETNLLVAFVRGSAAGELKLGITMTSPSNKKLTSQSYPMRFNGTAAEETASMMIQMRVLAEEDGVYWIGISADDSEITRVPLRLERSITRKPASRSDQSTKS